MQKFFRLVSLVCIGLLLFPPTLWAAGVTPDPNAPADKRPGMDAAPNGVPVVNITAASGSGLSHNMYKDFNVANQGLILNNSSNAVQTQLGGIIYGNPNFGGNAGRQASIILNEVTSTNRSYIQGYIEVGGRQADVILANPNGVTVNGGGFINVPRATITTGAPDVRDGALRGVDVRQGDVRVEGAGINAANADAFTILSRTAEIAGQVYARDLTVVTGQNRVDASGNVTAAAPAPESERPAVGVDSSLLGGMYANRITIMATEKGVGVNLEGTVQSADQMRITADGKLVLREAASGGDALLASNTEVRVQGSAAAGNSMKVQSGNKVAVRGVVAGGQSVAVTAQHVDMADSVVVSGLDSKGVVSRPGVTAITADTLAMERSAVLAGADARLTATRADIASSSVQSGGDTQLTAGQATLRGSTVTAARTLRFSGGHMESLGSFMQGAAVLLDVQGLSLGAQSSVEALTHLALAGGAYSLADSKLLSGGDFSAAVNSMTLDAASTLSAQRDMQLEVATLTLNGGFAAAGQDLFFRGDTLSNTGGVLFAARDQVLLADAALTNTSGEIYAGRDLHIGTSTGERTNTVRNLSGTMAAAGGNLNISAGTLENARLTLNIARNAVQVGGDYYSITTAWGSGDTRTWEDHYIRIMQDVVREATPAGVITAALDMVLQADSIINAHSAITAGGNITYAAANYTAIATNANQTRYEDIHYNHDDADGDYRDWGWEYRNNVEAVLQRFDATLVANGTLSGSVSDTLNNLGRRNADALPTANTGYDDFALARSPMFRPVGTPGHNYLIETDPRLTNFGIFYGSSYFLDRMGLDLAGEQRKLLGDAFFETRLIQQQILASTGQRFLSGYSTDADQMRGLMDAAYAQAEGLHLTVGVALSKDQVAALTQDVIWLVEQEYEGQKVLVPQLYLAAASRQDILTGGATMAAREVNITAGTINNTGGVIYGAQTLTAVADQIRNASGGLMGGGEALLASRGDLLNLGGTLQGDKLTLAAGGNIVSETTLNRSVTDRANISGSRLGDVASISAGSLSMQAGSDITLKGSQLHATGDASLKAGNNITVGTVVTGFNLDYGKYKDATTTNTGSLLSVGGNLTMQAANDMTVAGSGIAAGGNALLAAGNNLTVTAVQDTFLKAARSSSSSGMGGSKSESIYINTSTSKGSSVNAGGHLTLVAGNDPLSKSAVAVIGSQLGAAGTLTLQATGDVIVASAQNTAQSSFSKSSSGMFSSSSKKGGAASVTQVGSLLTGKDVVLDAGKSVFVSASGIAAQNDATLLARDGDVTLLTAENAASSWYSSKSSQFGLSFGSGEGTFSINYLEGKTRSDTSVATTSVGSAVMAGNDLTIVAGRDVTAIGAAMQAGQDIAIGAGRDVNITPGLHTSYEDHSKGTFTQGLTFTLTEELDKVGIFAGLTNTEKGKTVATTVDQGSVLAAGRDVLIRGGEDINVVGSQILAQRDMALDAGGNINVLEGRATEDVKQWQRNVQAGFLLEASQGVTGATKEMYRYVQDFSDMRDGVQGLDQGVSEASRGIMLAGKLGSIVNPSADIKLGFGVTGSYAESWSHSSTALGSSLTAGNDMVLQAGEDIHIRGAQLTAGNNAILTGNNVTIESAQSMAENGSWAQKFNAFAGLKAQASFSKGYEPPAGLNFTAGYGENRANSDAMTQSNASIKAGGLLGIESRNDTNILGATLLGNEVLMRVGNNLNIASRKDQSQSSASSASGEVSVTVSYGSAGASASGSVASSQSQSDFIGQQTSIIGVNGVDIRVEKNTDITGAAIVALNNNLKLDTGTLSYRDMRGSSSTFGFGFGGSLDVTSSTKNGELDKPKYTPRIGDLSLTIVNQDQLARATVGQGAIIIRDTSDQELAGLNRDLTMAIKKEDKTGFSVSIASPQKLYEVVSGGFGLKDAVSAWTWDPRAAEVQELRKGLEGKKIPADVLEAAKTVEELRTLYSKNELPIPSLADALSDMNNGKNTSKTILPQQWQYTQLKAQDTFNKKWTSIPIVDWFNK